MKRPSSPKPGAGHLRRWLFPAVALIVALVLFDKPGWLGPGFQRDAVVELLADGRVDQALDTLAKATDRHLIPELDGVNWWPAEARARRLALLQRDAERADPAAGPELAGPVGRHRSSPRVARLTAPAPRPLLIELHNRELGLLANTLPVAAGASSTPLDTTLIPGTTYDLALLDGGADGDLLSVAHFELLSPDVARDVGVVMATALELGGEGPGGELLAALVALHYGLGEEALTRFDALVDDPGVGPVAGELAAIALARMDLPAQAAARLAAARDG